MAGDKKTAIIIPAYNEEANISDIIAKIKRLMTDDMELVVVDDGSTDSTQKILKDTDTPCLTLAFNCGYGVAVQTGIKYAFKNNFEYVVLIDADGQHNPDDIFRLLDVVKREEADIVIGSRFLIETGYRGSIFRKLGKIFFSFIIYCLSGVKIEDPTSGFQALNRKVQKIYASRLFPVDYPDADMLLLLSYHNLRIKEIPVKMKVRKEKSMHAGLKNALYYIYKMLLSILVVVSYKEKIKEEGIDGH